MSILIKVYIIPNMVMVWKGFLYILRAGHTDFGMGGPKEGGGQGSKILIPAMRVKMANQT